VYRRCPGSDPAEQRKKVDLDWRFGSATASGMEGFSFNPLTQLQTWEPSQEEERKGEE
jgi:hypothetical protein